jgi:urease accessory protein
LYSIGFVAATGMLHGLGIAIGLVHKWKQGRIFLRASGAFVALAGCFFLWSAAAG